MVVDSHAMNDRAREAQASAPAAVGRMVGRTASDIWTLLELQANLLAIDARQSKARAVRTVVLGVAGSAVALVSLGCGVVALALEIARLLEWRLAGGLGAVALGGFLVATFLFGAAFATIRGIQAVFQRSGEEFRRNMTSIKRTLQPTPPLAETR